MESHTHAAPNESPKQQERSRTARALHCTTKAPLLHAAINRADISIKLGGNGGSLFYGLIQADGKQHRRVAGAHPPWLSSDPSSPGCLSAAAARTTGVIALGGGGRMFAVFYGVDLDVWLVAKVCHPSLVRSLRRTLQLSCEEVGIIAPIYTWEMWQSRCMLHELLHLATRTQEAG